MFDGSQRKRFDFAYDNKSLFCLAFALRQLICIYVHIYMFSLCFLPFFIRLPDFLVQRGISSFICLCTLYLL